MSEINMIPALPSQIEEPPMSRTHQYRKVMKPLLERKRRARINRCLDDIKDLLVDSLQNESGESVNKLEKADVLELTLKHLKELKRQKRINTIIPNLSGSSHVPNELLKQHFNNGYRACAVEVSQYLESVTLPLASSNLHSHVDSKTLDVNGQFGRSLMSHLGKHLQVIEMGPFLPFNQQSSSATQPLSVVTYCNDASKSVPSLPPSSSYRKFSTPTTSIGAISQFAVNASTRTLSSSSDCGYSSGRDSVSPHSLTSTALSPPMVGEIECPASPKINVEDLDEDGPVEDLSSSIPLNLVRRPASSVNSSSSPSTSDSVWRPF